MKQMHTTYVSTMLFISIKTIDKHLQHQERHYKKIYILMTC